MSNELERMRKERDQARAETAELREIVTEFIKHSAPLAELAQSQWADDNDLSQECHWLNETSKDAAKMLATSAGTELLAEPREKLAKFMLECSIATGHGDTFDDLLGELSGHLATARKRISELEATQKVCLLCGSPAEFRVDEQLWRHAGDIHGEGFMQTFCDKYGYPIPVRDAAIAEGAKDGE